MKLISDELKAHLAQEVTTLATCWKVTRRDGVVLGFTDHDADLQLASVTYKAASGFTPTAMDSSAQLNVDNLDIEGLLDAESISEADVLAGKYDYAQVEVFRINYAEPAQGELPLNLGWIGQVRLEGKQFVAELRGLTQSLTGKIGSHYTPACRAQLGDAKCKIDLAAHTVTSAVSEGSGRHAFSDDTRSEPDGTFAFGVVRFTSGANAGLSMEVKEFAGGLFTLVLPMPYSIQDGDAYTASAGCDKRFETCVSRFNNALNFRGEPHVPGTDKLLETASTRNAL